MKPCVEAAHLQLALVLLCLFCFPKGWTGSTLPRCLCVRKMQINPDNRLNRQVWGEASVLQTHLFLLEALQPLLHPPDPTQSKWVMAEGGWRALGGPSMGFQGGCLIMLISLWSKRVWVWMNGSLWRWVCGLVSAHL